VRWRRPADVGTVQGMATQWLDVSDTAPVVSYEVGSSPASIFTVPFVFFADTDLVVTVDGVLKTLATDYTVSGAKNPAGGTVTFLVAQTNATVLIVRDVPVKLDTHIPPSGPLDVPGLNIQFSKLVAMLQQQDDQFQRSVRAPPGETLEDGPPREARAGLIAAYDGAGNPTAVSTTFLSLGIGQRGQARVATTDNANLLGVGNDGFTKALLHFDGPDASTAAPDSNLGGAGKVWTASGNAQIDTAQSKFGGSSALFDGAGDWFRTPDHADFTFGSNEWTVECWFRRASSGALFITGQSDSAQTPANQSIFIQTTAGNVIQATATQVGPLFAQVTGTTQFTDVINPGWHHLAFVRTGNTLKLFIDGVQEGGNVSMTLAMNDSPNQWAVGANGEVTSSPWNGWIDEFRITNGVARWTSNFTPPAAPYGSVIVNGAKIDGVVLATGDLVLVRAQNAAAENGIYTVPASGAASRSSAFDTYAELLSSLIVVEEGATNSNVWINTNNAGGTLGATAITFARRAIDVVLLASAATVSQPGIIDLRTAAAAAVNPIVNSDFISWQLGFTLSNPLNLARLADRWNISYNGTLGTCAVSRFDLQSQSGVIPGSPRYAILVSRSVGGSGNSFFDISTQLDEAGLFAGDTITIAAWVNFTVLSTLLLKTEQFFGGGGSPSSPVFTTSDPITIPAGVWTPVTFTTTLASIAGKTKGSDGNDSLNIIFSLPPNAVGDYYITAVSVSLGEVALPWTRKPPGIDRGLIERYYQKSYGTDTAPGTAAFSGAFSCAPANAGGAFFIPFRRTMRKQPIVRLFNPQTGAENTWRDTTAGADRPVTAADVNDAGFVVNITSGGVAGNIVRGHWTADAEY
jgi:concanavalin A-like lectin/glucanase superfamily protein